MRNIHPFVQRAIQNIKLGKPKPIWYETITQHYPPLLFNQPQAVKGMSVTSKDIKSQIKYPEDRFRMEFYKIFPMELTKPVDLGDNKSMTTAEQAIRYYGYLIERGQSHSKAKEMAIEKFLNMHRERDKNPQ